MKKIFYLITVFIVSTGAVCIAQRAAPGGEEEDVLRPSPMATLVGPIGGIQYNFSSGSFVTTCDCVYSAGERFGPTFGAFLEYPYTRSISIIGEIAFQSFATEYSKRETRLEYLETIGDYVNADFERTAEVSLSFITIKALAKWKTGLEGLYVAAGPVLGILASSRMYEIEKIITPGIVYKVNNESDQVFFDAPLENMYSKNSMRISVDAGIGYDYYILPRFAITPQLAYSLPLTNVVSEYPDWKISALQFSIYAKIGL